MSPTLERIAYVDDMYRRIKAASTSTSSDHSGRSGVICKGEMTFAWEGRFETSLGPKRCNLRSGHASNAMLQCTALLKQSRPAPNLLLTDDA